MSETVYGQWAVDWDYRVDYAKLRRDRLESARKALKKSGLDAIVAYTMENVRYISGVLGGYTARFLAGYCVLAGDSEPIVYELGGDYLKNKISAPWMGDRLRIAVPIRYVEGDIWEDWTNQLKGTLKELGVRDGKIGFDTITFPMLEALKRAHIDAADANPAMYGARMLKTSEELKIIRQSVMLAEAAFEAAFGPMKPGDREVDLYNRMSMVLNDYGAEWMTAVTASGEHTDPYWRRPFTDKMIRPGDLVVIDRIHTWNGYGCDYVRTYYCGDKAPQEFKDLHRKCHAHMYKGIKQVKPGNKVRDIALALAEPEDWSTCTLDFGHSLGMVIQEPPWITAAQQKYGQVTIQPGMVFAIETHHGNGKQGVRLEENLIVTETGNEVISKYPFDPKLHESE